MKCRKYHALVEPLGNIFNLMQQCCIIGSNLSLRTSLPKHFLLKLKVAPGGQSLQDYGTASPLVLFGHC